MESLARIFKALADETRLAIVYLLFEYGELCVCDVEGILGVTQSKSSRHLRYLFNAGLVHNRREGVWNYYRVPEVSSNGSGPEQVLGALRSVLSEEHAGEIKKQACAWFTQKEQGDVCADDSCADSENKNREVER